MIVFYFRHEHFTSYELIAGGYPGFHGMKRLGVLLISLIGSPVTCHLSILSTPPYQVFWEVYLARFRNHLYSWMDRGRVREHQTVLGLEPFLLKLAFSIIYFLCCVMGLIKPFFIFSFLISIISKRRVNGRTPLISHVVDSILLAGEIRWWNQWSRIKGKPPQGKYYNVLYLRQYFTSPYTRFKIAQKSTAWHWKALKSNP